MIEVKKAGILSSLQDRGRFGYRNQGVPLSGAMDQYSAAFANQLLGNSPDCAVLEFALQGPTLFFHEACNIVICGNWQVELNGDPVDLNQVIEVPAKSTLKCKRAKSGMYGYLTVQNGFEAEKVLGSYSYYQNITQNSKLKNGQILQFGRSDKSLKPQHASVAYQSDLIAENKLAVSKGPEFDKLSQMQKEILFNQSFTASKDSNRMAYSLDHELELSAEEISTAPVQPGCVQLTPSGKLVVLMRDAQTTGGYARILQLSPMAINQLAQKRPGEKVSFQKEDEVSE